MKTDSILLTGLSLVDAYCFQEGFAHARFLSLWSMGLYGSTAQC